MVSIALNQRDLINRFIILLFLGLLVFYNSFGGKFLIDDHAFLANPTINNTSHLLLQFSPYQQIEQAIDPQVGGQLVYYRPLAHIVPALCYSLFGNRFWQYHLFNLVLFVIASFLIYLCVFRISRNDGLSFLVSVFYLIHPINGIVVNYITASVFSLQVIFISASILCVWDFVKNQECRILYYSSLLLMVLALLCHETSIMGVFYLAAVLVLTKCLDHKKLITCLIPYFLILLVYLLFRTYFVSLNDTVLQKIPAYKMNFFEYVATLFTIITWYLEKLILPHGIVMVWAMPVMRQDLLWANFGMVALISVFLVSFFTCRKNIIVQIGICWFLIGFLPMLAAPFSRPQDGVDIEPHWFVFSVIGFFIIIAHVLISARTKLGGAKNWIIAGLIFCLGISWMFESHQCNRLWSDEKTYTRYWLSQTTQIKSVYSYLAYVYMDEGNLQEGKKNYYLALTGSIDDALVYINLGSIEKKLGHFKQAEAFYQTSLRMQPNSFGIYANLGNLYLINGRLDLAKEYYIRSLIRNPYEVSTLRALISICLKKKDIAGVNKYAILYLEVERNPLELMRFGDAMQRDHFFDIALKSYFKAAENHPDYAQAQDLLTKEKKFLRILQHHQSTI